MNSRLKKVLKATAISMTMMLVLTGCGKGTSDSGDGSSKKPEFVFKLGHAADENNTWHKGAMKFAEEVSEKSNGRVEIKVYPNEQLGNEVDNVTGIQAGTADMVLSGESLQNWAENVGVMSTPFMIEDSDHLKAVVEGEPGKILEQEISDKVGLKVLTYFERGPRMLTSNKPINDINDVKGLKVRIPNVPLFVEMWNNWGAKPTPMAYSEIFTSLQQNTIEAQENPLALMNSGGFYEVQKYINDTAHVRGWIYLLIGNDQWNSLPEDLQQVITDAAKVAQEYEHELFLEAEEEILNSLIEEKGMEFVETDTTEMKAMAQEYCEKNLSPEMLELYKKIIETK